MTALLSAIVDDISQRRLKLLKSGYVKVHRLKNRAPPALLLGDHSVCDPPDPISNSAVKPDCADGTTAQALEE